MKRLRPGSALPALLLFAGLPGALGAAEPPSPLSLAEVLRRAESASPDLAAARNDLAQANAQRLVAAQLPNPSLSASVSKIPTDGTSVATGLGNGFFDRAYDSVVALSQPFELGGKRKDRRLSAQAGIEASGARLADAMRTVRDSVVRAYVAAVAAREGASVLEATAASLEKSAAIARAREVAGDASTAERIQVEVAAGRFRADADTARTVARGSVLALETLAGLPAAPDLPLASSLEDVATTLPGALASDPLDADVLEHRPDLGALRATERRQEAEVALQRAFRVPDPTLSVQYERAPPTQTNTAGVAVSLPLPLWNRNEGAIRSAEVALDAARLDSARAKALARADLVATREALDAAEKRARRFDADLIPAAAKARETVAFAYAEGGASLLELLEAERSANDVKLAALAARADLLSARAAYRSARALPLLPEDVR